MKARVLRRGDGAYPALLAQIPDPPSRLWLRGDAPPELLDRPAVAILAARPGVRSAGKRPVISLHSGDRVSHDAFGLGTVVRVEGDGDKSMAHVDFGEETGTKRLLLRYAPLVKL